MTETIAIKKLTTIASDATRKLQRIWMPLWRVLSFSPADDLISTEKNLSVAIQRGSLSIAYGIRFLSRITIRGVREYFFEEGRYPHPKEIVSSLALAASEFGAVKKDVILSIPKAWSVIRTAEFPSTIKENISAVVSYEMDRLTPFNSEEVFYDFRVLRDNDERLTLLLMATKMETLRPYIDALKEDGFGVRGITVNLSGMAALCRYMDDRADHIFVEIDEKGYEGALSVEGNITHTISDNFIAGDDKTKTDKISEDIKSLVDAAKVQGKSPQVAALLKDKSPTLRELFKLKSNLPLKIIGETDMRLRTPVPYKEIPYAAVGSVIQSLWPKAKGLNLLDRGVHEKQKTPILPTVILMLATAVLFILYMIAPLKVEKNRLSLISSQIEQKKEEVRKVESLKKESDEISAEINTINDFKKDRHMTLDIFKELTSILPKTTWLTKLRITGTTVDIEGYASSAPELLSKLETSKYFKKVEFASSTIRDIRMNSEKFTIKMELEGAGKNEGEKPKDEKK